MPHIMIRCPITQQAVATGLSTDTIILRSIGEGIEIPLRCPACLKLHKWERKDAWVEKEN
jgi:hypothetical protein